MKGFVVMWEGGDGGGGRGWMSAGAMVVVRKRFFGD